MRPSPEGYVEAVKRSPDWDHDLPAGCREANTKGPALEDRNAEFIFKSGNAAADRRRLDTQRLCGTRQVAGFRRDG
jgi:hypothetical protein